MHDLEAALRHVVELLPQALHRVDQVARQHQDARAGKQLGRLLLQPLDAGTDRERSCPSPRTSGTARAAASSSRNGGRQPPLEAVIDQPGVAVRTGHAVAAGVAQGQRRESRGD
jgi:hypothetical protein